MEKLGLKLAEEVGGFEGLAELLNAGIKELETAFLKMKKFLLCFIQTRVEIMEQQDGSLMA